MKRKQSVYRGLEFIPVYFEDNSFYHEKGGITFNHREEQPSNYVI